MSSRSGESAEGSRSCLSIVVVGNGPVGFRFIREIVERQLHKNYQLTVFGEEPRPAYDRVNLSRLFDSPLPDSLQYKPAAWYADHGIRLLIADPVTAIDRAHKVVQSRSGQRVSYDHLVLATGSRPFIPPLPGVDLEGVFAYRTIDDLLAMKAYSGHCRKAVVLGGGLLGLEAAHCLTKLGLAVTVVELGAVLMPRQMDTEGAALLQKMIQSDRLRTLLQRQAESIHRIGEGLQVCFTNGESLVADMIVVSAGIRARDELARGCDLPVARRGGIIVNNQLRTADPAISAIGECAEHNEVVYGLAAPGFRMANVVVDQLEGRKAEFPGSDSATRLKLVGVNVVFAGDYLNPVEPTNLVWNAPQQYVKLILRKKRLVGLIGVGEVPQFERLLEAIEQKRRLRWWHIRRFEFSGHVWSSGKQLSVEAWPASSVVCNCTGVTRGCLTRARERGYLTVESISAQTRAGTVCGSCLPLVRQFALVKSTDASTADSWQVSTTAVCSVIALILISGLMTAPPIPLPTSVQVPLTPWQSLISDDFWKQVTGYSLLGMLSLSLVISVRKRTRLLSSTSFASLRLVHVVLATAALGALIVHTGFHRGSHLSFGLFCVSMAASITGGVVGVLTGMESRLPSVLRGLRRPLTWGHILCLWPLPVLIVFHIVSVYRF